MIVGAAADETEPRTRERGRQRRRVRDDLLLVRSECRFSRFLEAHRLGRDDVNQWSTLKPREDGFVDIFRVLCRAQHHARSWAPQRLVGGRRHEVGMRYGTRMETSRDETG